MTAPGFEIGPGILRMDEPMAADRVVARLRAAGHHAVRVDRAPVFDQPTLMHALYQALSLPAWFGFNLDALADALSALDPVDGGRWVLVFQDFTLLETAEPALAEAFWEIVEEAASMGDAGLLGAVLLPGAPARAR